MHILHEFPSYHIDLTWQSHYYAAMRKITLTMSIIILLLTACSNHKSTTTPNNNSRVTVDPNNEASNPIIEQSSNTNEVDVEPTTQIVKTIPVAPPIDVLERIRRGFQFPEINSKYTESYLKWNTSHPTYLADLFARAEPFLYYIVEEIEKRGLPMELALLPTIESAYKPDAMSRSRASGLWQFIPSTGKSFGLSQDWWYDGRRDLIASTHAALDYLTQLNKMFDGDWHLTLAAYNAGQGTILRAISSNKRKGKSTNYQSLSLRSETVKYVPKLQAMIEIVKNPGRYNVSLPKIANQPYFETLELPGQIDIQQFSELAKLDICLLYTSPSPRDLSTSRMPSSA